MRLSKAQQYIIGIDEVGRGCLAGPVCVAAAAIPVVLRVKKGDRRVTLQDSKKLNVRQREIWFDYLKSHNDILYTVARVNALLIDRINIARAANLAAFRAFRALLAQHSHLASGVSIVLDGGLYLKNRMFQRENYPIAETRIRADETVLAVKVASVIAKGYRDHLMRRVGKHYPGYGFEIHKGYGTAQHRKALRDLGPTPLHRVSFISPSR